NIFVPYTTLFRSEKQIKLKLVYKKSPLKISFQSNFKGDLFIIYYLFFKSSLIDLVIPKLIPSFHVTNWREASLLSSKVLLISLTLSASSFKMSLKKD